MSYIPQILAAEPQNISNKKAYYCYLFKIINTDPWGFHRVPLLGAFKLDLFLVCEGALIPRKEVGALSKPGALIRMDTVIITIETSGLTYEHTCCRRWCGELLAEFGYLMVDMSFSRSSSIVR